MNFACSKGPCPPASNDAVRRPGPNRGPMRRLAAALLLVPALGCAAERIIFDTDATTFGDDGAALVMLLRNQTRFSIDGILATAGNAWPAQVAENVFHIFNVMERPAPPVYTGAEGPLMNNAPMAREFDKRWGPVGYMGAFAMDPNIIHVAPGSKYSAQRAHRNGVEFLISEIERHPGQVTIVELAPMTNLALALRLRPSIETKIKKVIFMGGSVEVPGNASPWAEFNFWFDPEAARIVLRSRIPVKVMFGLDCAGAAPLRKQEFDQIVAARTPVTELYRDDLGNRYPGFLRHPEAVGYMWDAIVAAYLVDPTKVVTKYDSRYLDVQTNWGKYYGATGRLDRAANPQSTPVYFVSGIDGRVAFEIYKTLLVRRDPIIH
jgi:inosine-uridine nucleoside N-ribohydrolase